MSFERNQQPPVSAKAPLIGAFTLGFAFGAFFDGILLHQVLQWHHLLSLVQGDLYRDIRVQILATVCFTLQPIYLRLAAWYCCGAGDRRDLLIALF
jgi:uncharacterized membrane protein